MVWDDVAMTDGFYKQLLEDSIEVFSNRCSRRGAVVGDRSVGDRLANDLAEHDLRDCLIGYFEQDESVQLRRYSLPSYRFEQLMEMSPDTIIITADADKEGYLAALADVIPGAPKVIVAGYGHFDFRDSRYWEIASNLGEPSLANGYPNSRIHLYQCLVNASKRSLDGIVVEFGMFRGGTTMFLSQVIEQLGKEWPIIGFDTFSGFPARRSYLDMYDHVDLNRVDLTEVQSYLAGRNVEVVPGDIQETVSRLAERPIVLAFVDTDNFTPAVAAIEAVRNNVVPGGALVFDHLTGVDRFRYTLGERMAAWRLFDDPRYFNLHGTGVFIRQVG